jgi:hypothetical protein
MDTLCNFEQISCYNGTTCKYLFTDNENILIKLIWLKSVNHFSPSPQGQVNNSVDILQEGV